MNSKNSGEKEKGICPSCKSEFRVKFGQNDEPLSLYCPRCGPKTFLGPASAYLNRREFFIVGVIGGLVLNDIYRGVKDNLSNFVKEKWLKRQSDEALRLFNKFIGYPTLSELALPEWIRYPDLNTPVHDQAAQAACSDAFGLSSVKIVNVRNLPFLSGVSSVVVGGASSSQFSKILMEQSVLDDPKKERPEFRGERAVLPLHWIPISEPHQLPDFKKDPSYVQFGIDDKGKAKAFSSHQWGFVRTDKDGRIDDHEYVMSRVDYQKSKDLLDKLGKRTVTCFSLVESPILITRISNFVGPGHREDKDDEKKLPPGKWSRVTLIDGATGPATGALPLLLNDPGPLSEAESKIDPEGDYQILLMATGISTGDSGTHWASGIEYRGAVNLQLSDQTYLNAYRKSGPHYDTWIRSKSFTDYVLEGKFTRE